MKRRKRLALALWGVSVAILAYGAWAVRPGSSHAVISLDHAGMAWAHGLREATLDQAMQAVTWLGSLWLLLPASILASLILLHRQRRRDALFVMVALLGASLLSHLTKLMVMRPRPDLFQAWTTLPPDWSYPSAHTMQVTAAALVIVLLMARNRTHWATACATCLLVVGFSRVYLQVHFPSDVIIGALTAGCWVTGLYLLMYGQTPGAPLPGPDGEKR